MEYIDHRALRSPADSGIVPASGSPRATPGVQFERGERATGRGTGANLFASAKAARPRLKRALATGFVTSRWSFWERKARAARHFDIAAALGRPFNLALDEYVELIDLSKIAPGYVLKLDQPAWFVRDGLLTLGLWLGPDRIFSLSFVFAMEGDGLAAYVGGLQGRADTHMLDLYRTLTKAASGMRPRDLLIELFRMICEQVGVSKIYAASSTTNYYRSYYFRIFKRGSVPITDYDSPWTERGGLAMPNGLFELAPGLHLRDLAEVPAKKRSMYRARYALLSELQCALTLSLAFPDKLAVCRARGDRRREAGRDEAITAGSGYLFPASMRPSHRM